MPTLLFVLFILITWFMVGMLCGVFVFFLLKEEFTIKDAMICGLMGGFAVHTAIVVFCEKRGDKVLVDFSKRKNKKEKN